MVDAPGFQQPIGWGERATITDPTARHQIKLCNTGGNNTVVTCNCGDIIDDLQPGDDPHAMYATHLARLGVAS